MKHLQFNFANRKYRMLFWEFWLFILFIALYNGITVIFPLTTEPIRNFDNDYWLYMLLMLIDLALLAAMFFIAGMWFNDWRRDNNTDSQVLEMVSN